MTEFILQTVKEAIMKTLRSEIINWTGMAMKDGNEARLISLSLNSILEKLKSSSDKEWYDLQTEIKRILGQSCSLLIASLVALRSGQQLDAITGIEKSFAAKEKEVQIQFLNRVLAPLCLEADRVAIEIAVYFLHEETKAVECAKKILIVSGKKVQGKNIIAGTLQKHLPGRTCALGILAEVDAGMANAYALKNIKDRDEDIRQEALRILSKADLSEDTCREMVAHLRSAKSKVLWEDSDHRGVVYDFIQHAFIKGVLKEKEVRVLIRKAFRSEKNGYKLGELISVIGIIFPEDNQIVFDGFIAMEAQKTKRLFFCKNLIKEFISKLEKPKCVEFLQKLLLISMDTDVVWFVGQQLIAIDVAVAAETFAACAKKEDTPEKIGTMAQLAMRICGSDSGWGAEELNKKSRACFLPVPQALLDFAQTDEGSNETRLAIAFQPGMFGGNTECCRRANLILEKILLDENSSSEQVTKALQALLSCHGQKKKLRSGIEAILKKAYNSNCKERLLMQLLEIMSKDLRGYSEPLFGPIVKFAKNIQAIDAVWLLEKALQAPLPDADLGMGARELYIEALKKFALEDSERAVAVIAGYRGGNIDSHVIPRALVAIYKGVTTKEIKNVVARNVAERFVYSVAREKKDSVFYLYELEAVKALKQEVIVQEAFLEGVIAIGDVDMGRPNRMSEVVKNISMILPVEKKSQILGALKQLVEKLAIARQERAAKHICTSNVDRDNFIIAIDTICTEASLAMLAI